MFKMEELSSALCLSLFSSFSFLVYSISMSVFSFNAKSNTFLGREDEGRPTEEVKCEDKVC